MMFSNVVRSRDALPKPSRGFTLVELIVAVAIVSILAAIAIPSYTRSIAKTKRRAAQTCLASLATQMERYYTTNLRYCADANGDGACDGADFTLPSLDCRNASNAGANYDFSATSDRSTFTVQAAPKTAQASRDSACGTLTLDQAGVKRASGTTDASICW